MEMVLKACENTINISNPNIGYIEGILSSWNKKGIKEIEFDYLWHGKPPTAEEAKKFLEELRSDPILN